MSVVDVRDIAAVAAIALTESGHEGATYTLTGPASITHTEIAAALTSSLGRDITFTDIPPDAPRRELAGHLAAPADRGPPGGLRALPARGSSLSFPEVAELTGRPARDVSRFAHDYASAFTS